MKQRRWMTSILKASTEKQIALPFQRGQRSRPAALKPAVPSAPRLAASAAH